MYLHNTQVSDSYQTDDRHNPDYNPRSLHTPPHHINTYLYTPSHTQTQTQGLFVVQGWEEIPQTPVTVDTSTPTNYTSLYNGNTVHVHTSLYNGNTVHVHTSHTLYHTHCIYIHGIALLITGTGHPTTIVC